MLSRGLRRKTSVRRVFVHRCRKLARQSVEDLLLRQAGLLLQFLKNIRTDSLLEFGRGDFAVWPLIDPGLSRIALPVLPEVLEQLADPAVQQRTDAAAGRWSLVGPDRSVLLRATRSSREITCGEARSAEVWSHASISVSQAGCGAALAPQFSSSTISAINAV